MKLPARDNSESRAKQPDATADKSVPSVFADLVDLRPVVRAVTMTDIAGLVVGFAVAATIYRGTILTVFDAGAVGVTIVAAIAFAWLGTSISGPIVLAIRRVQSGRRSWSWGKRSAGETIWGVLGLMWLAVGLSRSLRTLNPALMSNVASISATAAAAFAPLLLILYWWLLRSRPNPGGPYTWCHHVGIACSAMWPAGWTLAAFLLGV
jgi:hypothetical protein